MISKPNLQTVWWIDASEYSSVSLENLLTAMCLEFYSLPPWLAYSEENRHHIRLHFCFFTVSEHQGTACSLHWAFSVGSLWTSTQQQTFHTMGDYTGLIPRLHPRPRTNSGEELKQLTALCPKGKNNGKQVISSDSPWIGLRLLNKVPCLCQWHFCKVMPFSDFLWLISA